MASDTQERTTSPIPIATQFNDVCNLTNFGVERRVLYVYGLVQAPIESLEQSHFALIVCTLGCLQPAGVLLNILTLRTLCREYSKGTSITILLQALVFFDIVYLASHFTGLVLPALFQHLVNASRSCVVSDVARFRIQGHNYFDLAMGLSRDLVVWQMILISEYCLIPYCCAGRTTRKLYNKCFAIFETIIVFLLVACINVFMFLCKTLWALDIVANYYPLVEMFNVFLPFGCILVMYFGIVIQIASERMTRRNSLDDQDVDELHRGFSTLFLFVICEIPYVIHWILRWNLVQNLTTVFDYYMIGYVALICKHVNCVIKFFVLTCASTKFRYSLQSSCNGSGDDEIDDYDFGDKVTEDERLMCYDESEARKSPFVEVSQV